MKNFIKIIGIVAMAAIIGFAFAACEGPMGPQGEQGIQGDQGEKGEPGATGPSAGRWPEKLSGTWRNTEEFTDWSGTYTLREWTFSHDEAGSGETMKYTYMVKDDPEKKEGVAFILITNADDKYWLIRESETDFDYITFRNLSISNNQITVDGTTFTKVQP